MLGASAIPQLQAKVPAVVGEDAEEAQTDSNYSATRLAMIGLRSYPTAEVGYSLNGAGKITPLYIRWAVDKNAPEPPPRQPFDNQIHHFDFADWRRLRALSDIQARKRGFAALRLAAYDGPNCLQITTHANLGTPPKHGGRVSAAPEASTAADRLRTRSEDLRCIGGLFIDSVN